MSIETVPTRKRGRPRSFDPDELLDNTVETFWKYGLAGTTTRVLEDTLGVSQSSLYNAYGSKDDLLSAAIDLYEGRLQRSVLAKLAAPSRAALLEFVDAVAAWVCDPDHPGCLVMNLASEHPDHAWRLDAYRVGLFEGISACLATFLADPDQVGPKADLLTSAVLGLNVSAKCGGGGPEIGRMAAAIKMQVASW